MQNIQPYDAYPCTDGSIRTIAKVAPGTNLFGESDDQDLPLLNLGREALHGDAVANKEASFTITRTAFKGIDFEQRPDAKRLQAAFAKAEQFKQALGTWFVSVFLRDEAEASLVGRQLAFLQSIPEARWEHMKQLATLDFLPTEEEMAALPAPVGVHLPEPPEGEGLALYKNMGCGPEELEKLEADFQQGDLRLAHMLASLRRDPKQTKAGVALQVEDPLHPGQKTTLGARFVACPEFNAFGFRLVTYMHASLQILVINGRFVAVEGWRRGAAFSLGDPKALIEASRPQLSPEERLLRQIFSGQETATEAQEPMDLDRLFVTEGEGSGESEA